MNLALHDGDPVNNLVVVNNIFGYGRYGWNGSGTTRGTATLQRYAAPWTFESNAIYSENAAENPPGNFFPSDVADVGFVDAAGGNYRLASGSSLKGVGVEGEDLGADIDTIEALTAGVR